MIIIEAIQATKHNLETMQRGFLAFLILYGSLIKVLATFTKIHLPKDSVRLLNRYL